MQQIFQEHPNEVLVKYSVNHTSSADRTVYQLFAPKSVWDFSITSPWRLSERHLEHFAYNW